MKNTIKTYLSGALILSALILLTGCNTAEEVSFKAPVTKTKTSTEVIIEDDTSLEGEEPEGIVIEDLETESEILISEDAALEAEINALEEADF